MKPAKSLRVTLAAALISGALAAQSNSTIPLQITQPNIASPLDTMRKLQEIRETQERIRQMQEQTLQIQQRRTDAQAQTKPAADAHPPAQAPLEGIKTGKQLNGRLWIAFPSDDKLAWLTGFMEAHLLWSADMSPQKQSGELNSIVFNIPTSLTVGELSESLDRFYSEPTNRIIPIVYALTWVDLKTKGAAASALNGWEEKARSISVDVLAGK